MLRAIPGNNWKMLYIVGIDSLLVGKKIFSEKSSLI